MTFTEEQRDTLRKCAAVNLSQKNMAAMIKVSLTSLLEYLKKDKELKKDLNYLKAELQYDIIRRQLVIARKSTKEGINTLNHIAKCYVDEQKAYTIAMEARNQESADTTPSSIVFKINREEKGDGNKGENK